MVCQTQWERGKYNSEKSGMVSEADLPPETGYLGSGSFFFI